MNRSCTALLGLTMIGPLLAGPAYARIFCDPSQAIVAPCENCGRYYEVTGCEICPDGRWHVMTSDGGYFMDQGPRAPDDVILVRPSGQVVWADRATALYN